MGTGELTRKPDEMLGGQHPIQEVVVILLVASHYMKTGKN